MTVLHYIIK